MGRFGKMGRVLGLKGGKEGEGRKQVRGCFVFGSEDLEGMEKRVENERICEVEYFK